MNRRNTNSVKWDLLMQQFGSSDVLPMWVADMDLPSPPEVVEALKARAAHPIYGYTIRPDSYYQAFMNWVGARHNWDITQDWLVDTPGVVPAMAAAVQIFTEPGDQILVQSPVYYPFFNIIKNNDRELVTSSLLYADGQYTMDFLDLRKKFANGVKMILLCNPHNPVGRVWTEAELNQLGNLCLEYDVKIIADEIWSDLVFKNHKHLPIAKLSPEIAHQTITCMAPSKTFNIAGLNNAIAVIPNRKWHQQYTRHLRKSELMFNNLFAVAGFEAAYTHGAAWLEETLTLIEKSREYVITELSGYHGVEIIESQGTYLLWINFGKLAQSHEKIQDALVKVGRIGLSDGKTFGSEGECFFRMNIGCSPSLIETGVSGIKLTIDHLLN